MSKEEILKVLPEKKELCPTSYGEDDWEGGYNTALDSTASKLAEREVFADDLRVIFDKFVFVGVHKIGILLNKQARDKIIEALKQSFIILRRK